MALDIFSRQILAFLLQAQSPVATKRIANELGLSPRMVHYRLKNVAGWAESKQLGIKNQPGVGIFIDAPYPQKQSLRSKIIQQGSPLYLKPKERQASLILLLLFQDKPLIVMQLKHQLNASRTTIMKDLKLVDDWFRQHQLRLKKRQNFGCVVEGEELDRRKALVDCLVDCIESVRLWSLFGDKYSSERLSQIEKLSVNLPLVEILKQLEVSFFIKLAFDLNGIRELRLKDKERVALTLELAVLTHRIRKGYILPANGSQAKKINHLPEFGLAQAIAGHITKKYSLSLPPQEIAYIVHYLTDIADDQKTVDIIDRQTFDRSSNFYTRQRIDPIVLFIVDELISGVSAQLHPALKVDSELDRNLVRHLSKFYSLPKRQQNKNPLLAEIRRQYTDIYDVVRGSIEAVNQSVDTKLPEDEVGYLSMYIAAALEKICIPKRKSRFILICDVGGATEAILASRLQVEFPDAEIVGIMSYFDFNNRMTSLEYDLVVSTLPFEKKDIPVITVSPLLSYQDVTRIRAFIKEKVSAARKDNSLEMVNVPPGLMDLINLKTIKLKAEADNWKEAVHIAGRTLLDLQSIEPRFIEAMIHTILDYGPYMVLWPGVALLHARPEDGVRQLCLSLTTFRKPVNFGHPQHDPVDIAIVLGAVDNRAHIPALLELNNLIQDAATVKKLRESVYELHALNIISRFCRSIQAKDKKQPERVI